MINQGNSSNTYRNSNRILLVDDEPDITFSFNMILEDNGFAVDSYNDPIHALSSFKSGIYAIAILDIRMPGMNGFQVMESFRLLPMRVSCLAQRILLLGSAQIPTSLIILSIAVIG